MAETRQRGTTLDEIGLKARVFTGWLWVLEVACRFIVKVF